MTAGAGEQPSAVADDGTPPPDGPDEVNGFKARRAEQIAAWRQRADELAERHRDRPVVAFGLRLYARDKEAAGSVLGSAVAFRLFLFFVPMLLFVVGALGFLDVLVERGDISEAGITGGLATQIDSALEQPTATRWTAVLLGLFGMLSAGRTLSKVMIQASCLTWRLPLSSKAPVRVIGGVIGLVVGAGLVAFLVNRVRHELGLGVTSVSFLVAFAVYAVIWLLLAMLLPRATTDPGALLPGAVLNAAVLAGLQALSQLYLPDRLSRASSLYGAVGTTVVVLGWFFFLGRALVLSMALNAVIYERYGSISRVIFALPVLRALPRRWPWVGRFFQLPDRAE